MPKKPRRAPRLEESRPIQKREEFQNCHASGCPNIVSIVALPQSYSGSVYCILHRDRYVRKHD